MDFYRVKSTYKLSRKRIIYISTKQTNRGLKNGTPPKDKSAKLLLVKNNVTFETSGVTLHSLQSRLSGLHHHRHRERADSAARSATQRTDPDITTHLSPAQIKSQVTAAAFRSISLDLRDYVATCSRSATYYTTATKQEPLVLPPRTAPHLVHHLHRLRLGFLCASQIYDRPEPCEDRLEEDHEPLLHYQLRCPVTQHLRNYPQDQNASDTEKAAAVVALSRTESLLALCKNSPPPR